MRKGVIILEIPVLSYEELENIKSCFYSFVTRVAGTEKKLPEEVQILPAMTDILLRFTD